METYPDRADNDIRVDAIIKGITTGLNRNKRRWKKIISSDKIIAACKLFFVQHWLEVEKTEWYATITEEKKEVLIKSITSLIEEKEDAAYSYSRGSGGVYGLYDKAFDYETEGE